MTAALEQRLRDLLGKLCPLTAMKDENFSKNNSVTPSLFLTLNPKPKS